jgi:hypothetical protein
LKEFYVISDKSFDKYVVYTHFSSFTANIHKCEHYESLDIAKNRKAFIEKHYKDKLYILKINLTIEKELCV